MTSQTPEETQDTEVEEMVARLLLRTYDRCFVRGRVPPEVGSSIAHYNLFLKEELANLLHHQLQKAREEVYKEVQVNAEQCYRDNGRGAFEPVKAVPLYKLFTN